MRQKNRFFEVVIFVVSFYIYRADGAVLAFSSENILYTPVDVAQQSVIHRPWSSSRWVPA
jgi:hypothetical protein